MSDDLVLSDDLLLIDDLVLIEWTILPDDFLLPEWIELPFDIIIPWEVEIVIDVSSTCWNWIQDPWENCQNCPQDIEDCLYIVTQDCNQCPCPFVDINSNLTKNDIVKAVLWDIEKKYPRRYSLWLPIF